MKRLCLIIAILLVMCGCSNEKVFETVSDELQSTAIKQRMISVELPENVAIPTMEDDTGAKIYIGDNYTVTAYTLTSGDLNKTIQTTTGYDSSTINLVSTQNNGIKRYDCTWTSAGEGSLQVCRAAILDDGNYHYVVSAMGDSTLAADFADEWQSIFGSFTVIDTD